VDRGFGVARAQGYGTRFEEYITGWNERSTIIIQIESIQGIEAVDELLQSDLINGVMIGPYDISGSLGIPGQLEHPRLVEACARVVEACAQRGKACGTQLVDPTHETTLAAFEGGYTFVVLASDVFILWKWSERMRQMISAHRRTAHHERRGVRAKAR
jgi:2-dehydro-3-deoxyglucarate aldolase